MTGNSLPFGDPADENPRAKMPFRLPSWLLLCHVIRKSPPESPLMLG